MPSTLHVAVNTLDCRSDCTSVPYSSPPLGMKCLLLPQQAHGHVLVNLARHGDTEAALALATQKGLARNVDYMCWVLDAYASACADGSVETARWLVRRFALPQVDCDLATQFRANVDTQATTYRNSGGRFPCKTS